MARYCLGRDLKFLHHRHQTPFAEIDLIFRGPQEDWLIEVKSMWAAAGRKRVSRSQKLRLERAFLYWLETHKRPTRMMLAVVSQPLKINLIEDFLS